ncbi:MAG: hypothetical protein KDC46_03280 [Thermoleophilia bacterium]|nr:hypothetical protein [Thermoleophilia bacterium]
MQHSPATAAAPTTSLYAAILDMDAAELEEFRTRLRRRYDRDELLQELRDSAERIGASPTMRQFAEDPEATIHPQTIVDHFGSWNAAKREAGLMVRRRATNEELLQALRDLGEQLGRRPSTKDIEAARGRVPSRGVYCKAFGSMREALRLAGFDAPSKDERMQRSIDHGAAFLLRTGRLPSFRDWERIRGDRQDVMTAWQLYRAFEQVGGAWSAFQFKVDERAAELQGAAIAA